MPRTILPGRRSQNCAAIPPQSSAGSRACCRRESRLECGALTESAILDAMALVGGCAETITDRCLMVRSVPHPENLAYSDLGLGLHTDNPVPGARSGFQPCMRCWLTGRRGKRVRRRFAAEQSTAGDRPSGVRCPDANTRAVQYRSRTPISCGAPFDSLSCRGEVNAVHYTIVHSAAADRTRAAAISIAPTAASPNCLREPGHQLRFALGTAISCSSTTSEFLMGAPPFRPPGTHAFSRLLSPPATACIRKPPCCP